MRTILALDLCRQYLILNAPQVKGRTMKGKLLKCVFVLVSLHAGMSSAETVSQSISRLGSQNSMQGAASTFTGRVRVDPQWPARESINASGVLVTFEPGARSAWHTHPAGQQLVIISGSGLTQEWGKPIQRIQAGDVVWCPPNVKHWHGAAPNIAMTHLAVTGVNGGKNVTWMEKVSDEQYSQ